MALRASSSLVSAWEHSAGQVLPALADQRSPVYPYHPDVRERPRRTSRCAPSIAKAAPTSSASAPVHSPSITSDTEPVPLASASIPAPKNTPRVDEVDEDLARHQAEERSRGSKQAVHSTQAVLTKIANPRTAYSRGFDIIPGPTRRYMTRAHSAAPLAWRSTGETRRDPAVKRYQKEVAREEFELRKRPRQKKDE